MISRPKNYFRLVRPLENLKEWLIKIEDIDCLALEFNATPPKNFTMSQNLELFSFLFSPNFTDKLGSFS